MTNEQIFIFEFPKQSICTHKPHQSQKCPHPKTRRSAAICFILWIRKNGMPPTKHRLPRCRQHSDRNRNADHIQGVQSVKLGKTLRENATAFSSKPIVTEIQNSWRSVFVESRCKVARFQFDLSSNPAASRCGIGDEGCKDIAKYLFKIGSIHKLLLKQNNMKDDGCGALADKPAENISVTTLELDSGDISPKDWDRVQVILERNWALRELIKSEVIAPERYTELIDLFTKKLTDMWTLDMSY
jgi:hypothetical protein